MCLKNEVLEVLNQTMEIAGFLASDYIRLENLLEGVDGRENYTAKRIAAGQHVKKVEELGVDFME